MRNIRLSAKKSKKNWKKFKFLLKNFDLPPFIYMKGGFYMDNKIPLTNAELASIRCGEAITLAAVMAIMVIAIVVVVLYKLFQSTTQFQLIDKL